MKYVLILALLFTQAFAQKTAIKGDINIRYNTRTLPGKSGITDKYTLNINVADSAIFRGTIEHQPTIKTLGVISQSGQLVYSMDWDVVNPANPTQTRNVGKLFGAVPIDGNNVYRFAEGNLQISVFGIGSAKAFDSKFTGVAAGKPPSTDGMFSKLKKETLNLTKMVGGKAVAISVKNYDRMEFQDHGLAMGPVQIYSDVKVNGSMIYDYDRAAWHFQGVTVSYASEGRQMQDRLGGSIRWIESPNRKVNGEGEYQFDIRVNEPAATEGTIFAAATDESAFFATDDLVASLTGTMKYKDTVMGDKVTLSSVQVALAGNKLTKQQTMYLAKLLFHSSIVPINAE